MDSGCFCASLSPESQQSHLYSAEVWAGYESISQSFLSICNFCCPLNPGFLCFCLTEEGWVCHGVCPQPLTRAGPTSAECPPVFLQTLWWRSSPSLVQITLYFPVVSRRPDEDWKATGNAALMLANKTNQPNTNLEGKLQCDKKKF